MYIDILYTYIYSLYIYCLLLTLDNGTTDAVFDRQVDQHAPLRRAGAIRSRGRWQSYP